MEELLGQDKARILEVYRLEFQVETRAQTRTMEKRKTEDSSCSLPSHFWSTFRSAFFTYYIPFQRSGSQQSNASNRVQFEAEMRKIWHSEDNCIKMGTPFRKEIFFMVRNLAISHHEEHLAKFRKEDLGTLRKCKISSVSPRTHHRLPRYF